MQDCSNSSALAMEILHSRTKPSICRLWGFMKYIPIKMHAVFFIVFLLLFFCRVLMWSNTGLFYTYPSATVEWPWRKLVNKSNRFTESCFFIRQKKNTTKPCVDFKEYNVDAKSISCRSRWRQDMETFRVTGPLWGQSTGYRSQGASGPKLWRLLWC